jgi:hypothetical protein
VQALNPLDYRPRQEFSTGSFDNVMKIAPLAAVYSLQKKQTSKGTA